MDLQDHQQEISMLELRLKNITEEFDKAISNGMVLHDVKRLFHELRIISDTLLELKTDRPVKGQ